jgi:hypothetical protein
LVTRPNGRQRHDETGAHGCIDARKVESDEEHVAYQRGEGALDRKAHRLGIVARVRQQKASLFRGYSSGCTSAIDAARDGQRDLIQRTLEVDEWGNRLSVLLVGERCPLAGRWQPPVFKRASGDLTAVCHAQEALVANPYAREWCERFQRDGGGLCGGRSAGG